MSSSRPVLGGITRRCASDACESGKEWTNPRLLARPFALMDRFCSKKCANHGAPPRKAREPLTAQRLKQMFEELAKKARERGGWHCALVGAQHESGKTSSVVVLDPLLHNGAEVSGTLERGFHAIIQGALPLATIHARADAAGAQPAVGAGAGAAAAQAGLRHFEAIFHGGELRNEVEVRP